MGVSTRSDTVFKTSAARTLLLVLLTLIAVVGRAMPCPAAMQVATLVSPPAPEIMPAGHDAHCSQPAAGQPGDDVPPGNLSAVDHATMNLGDCLAQQPGLHQVAPTAQAPAPLELDLMPLPWLPGTREPPAPILMRAAQPPPERILASQHWTATQRLLL